MIRFVAVLLSIVLVLVGLEMACRLSYETLVPEKSRMVLDILRGDSQLSDHSAFLPHPYGLYINNPTYGDNNPLGYRGPEITLEKKPGLFRILALGGSTTYGLGTSGADAWPAQLERKCKDAGYRVEVINAGLNAGTSAEILAQYMFIHWQMKPDLIMYDAGWNDAAMMILDDYSSDYRNRSWFNPLTPRRGERWLLSHSYTARFFYALWIGVPNIEMGMTFPGMERLTAEQAMANQQAHEPAGYAHNLDTLLTMAATSHTPFLLFLEPTAPAEITQHSDSQSIQIYPALRAAFERTREVTRKQAAAHGVPLVDMKQDSIPLAYFFDRSHVNRDGNALKVEAMYPAVEAILKRQEAH